MAFSNSIFREFYDLHIGKSPIYKLPNKTRGVVKVISLQMSELLFVFTTCFITFIAQDKFSIAGFSPKIMRSCLQLF